MLNDLFGRRSRARQIVVNPLGIGLSDPVVNGLIESAGAVAKFDEGKTPEFTNPGEAAMAARETEQKRAESKAKFQGDLISVVEAAYNGGYSAATDIETQIATNSRSYVLYLVVLAVVLMPLIAMITKVNPQTFGAYIAPVTGIAGTVVGYWFGTVDRRGDRRPDGNQLRR